jgi:hypothetical protein
MSRKIDQDPVTGVIKQPIGGLILAGLFFFSMLVWIVTMFPSDSKGYLYISLPFGVFGLVNLIWINLRPNLYARFFLNTCISGLCLLMSYRALDNLLPRYSYVAASSIIIIGVVAHILPIWNPKAANFIRDELAAPKTPFGKVVFKGALVLIPFVGILAAIFTTTLQRENKSIGLSFMLAFLGLLTVIVLPFAYRFPSSPWEIKKK